jgi:superfamily II DNA helicase RecQ
VNISETQLAIKVANILNTVMGPKRLGIIFCPSHIEADKLGSHFTQGCISHSQLPDGKKIDNEAEWKAGKKQWIAATAELALSTNSPMVGGVIFLGIKCGMNFLYQGAGQSGRDGEQSWVVVLQSEHNHFASVRIDDSDPQCLVESQAWLQANQCRRLGFTKLYDNATVSCTDLLNAHFCDFCEPDSDLVVKLKELIIN